MSESLELESFLMTNCGMKKSNAVKISEALDKVGVDGKKIAQKMAKDGSLRKTLDVIFAADNLNSAYVSIIMDELNKSTRADVDLNAQRKDIDAVIKVATELREAVIKESSAVRTANRSSAEAALTQVTSGAEVSAPAGTDLLSKAQLLIKDLTKVSEVLSAGKYDSDFHMLSQVSCGALRKASIFLPGGFVGHRAPNSLFSFKTGVTKTDMSETQVHEEYFSSNEVFAIYKNNLVRDGSATSISAEAGAFFGTSALGFETSLKYARESERGDKVNALSEAREAHGIIVHCVKKASFEVKRDDIILEYPDSIATLEQAKIFLEDYGTHLITAPQSLGGLYLLSSTVTFKSSVKSDSYTDALSKTLQLSASLSGWGALADKMKVADIGVAHDITNTKAHAEGTKASNDTYTANTQINILGPSCNNADVFRTSLDQGNKSWCFINNGLSFEKHQRDRVVSQILPVWKLFHLAGRHEEAKLLREAWINSVIDTEAILDPDSFFSKLLYRTLQEDGMLKSHRNKATPESTETSAVEAPPRKTEEEPATPEAVAEGAERAATAAAEAAERAATAAAEAAERAATAAADVAERAATAAAEAAKRAATAAAEVTKATADARKAAAAVELAEGKTAVAAATLELKKAEELVASKKSAAATEEELAAKAAETKRVASAKAAELAAVAERRAERAAKADWAKIFKDHLDINRAPPVLRTSNSHYTHFSEHVHEDMSNLQYHTIGAKLPLTSFEVVVALAANVPDKVRYEYRTASLEVGSWPLTVTEAEDKTQYTPALKLTTFGKTQFLGVDYLHGLKVKAPVGAVLTGFRVEYDSANNAIRYVYTYGELWLRGTKFTYSESAVVRGETEWFYVGVDGEYWGTIKCLDKVEVRVPVDSLLVGFRLEYEKRGTDNRNIRYVYWHVPASALKHESKW